MELLLYNSQSYTLTVQHIPDGPRNTYEIPTNVQAVDVGMSNSSFRLLKIFLQHQYLTRDQVISLLWPNPDSEPEYVENAANSRIIKLRKELRAICSQTSIHGIHGGVRYLGTADAPPIIATLVWQHMQLNLTPGGGILIGEHGEVKLTATEAQLCRMLFVAGGQCVPRTHTIANHHVIAHRLRRKLSTISTTCCIEVVHSEGYRLVHQADNQIAAQ